MLARIFDFSAFLDVEGVLHMYVKFEVLEIFSKTAQASKVRTSMMFLALHFRDCRWLRLISVPSRVDGDSSHHMCYITADCNFG